MELDKFDIARNALCGAIFTYIFTPYHSAAHTLAGACIEIVNTLMSPQSKRSREKAAFECKSLSVFCKCAGKTEDEYNLFIKDIRNIYSFLKHADRDPQEKIKINPKVTEHYIFLAIRDYAVLCRGIPIEAQVYEAWYLAINPDKIEKSQEKNSRNIATLFPNITNIDHEQQKEMCRQLLVNTAGKPEYLMEEIKPTLGQ